MSHQRMTRDTSALEGDAMNQALCQRDRNKSVFWKCLALLVAVTCALPAAAQQPTDTAAELSNARRVFVPVEDLDVVVDRDHRGAVLTKKKFDELLELAKANAAKGQAPQLPITLTASDYQARVAGDQLLLSVTAELTQFTGDWQSITFPMQRLAIEKATLNGEPAMLGRGADGSVSLLSDTKGKHTLKLELSTELTSQGSDQVAAFSLLRAPTGTLSLTLPAGKRLLIGALQLERPAPLEKEADYQIAVGGAPGVQLRITDRAADNSADALTIATTGYGLHVAPGEVTWHALTSLQVFGKPIDRLTFSIPTTLEIADVEATGLEAWVLADDPNDKQRTIITVTFGQAFDGNRKISFKGVMAAEAGKPWSVPPLRIEKITSHIGQVLVQHNAGVRLRVEETVGVRRATQGQKPAADMPDDMAKMNATEFLRFDVWQPDFVLRLTTQPKQREVQTAIAAVLDVNATGLDLQALITVETHFAPLFEVDVRLPADWKVVSASRDDKPQKWQVLSLDEPGVNQLRVMLDPPLPSEGKGTVQLVVRRDVEGWPVENTPITVALPELYLPQSSLSEMAFVVRGDDDLDLAASELTGLDTVPLKADFERLRFQSQDTRYGGQLKVTRKPSRISAQSISVGRLDPQTMHVFIQALVEIQGGGVRILKVAMPESTGTSLRFQCPIRQIVEQKPGAVQNGERIWTLQFDQRVRGVLPLFCDLDLPRGDAKEFSVPQARIVEAERQNGYLAAEAGGEQRLTITAKAADGTPLSEVDALDMPDVYYVPKERVVAVYRAVTTGATLTLGEERFDKLAVPTAVCPILDVTSVLGRTGEFQHRATFALTAVGVQGLRVILPSGTASKPTTLWATLVDGKPVEVRRQGDIYLVPLSSQGGMATHTLQLFYKSEVSSLTQIGSVEQPPPELSVQSGQGTSQPVEILDQRWELYYPSSTLLVSSTGPLEPLEKLDQTSLLARLTTSAKIPTMADLGWHVLAVIVTVGVIALFVLAHRKGVNIGLTSVVAVLAFGILIIALLLPATQTAREAARRSQSKNVMRQQGMAVSDYGDAKSEPESSAASESAPMIVGMKNHFEDAAPAPAAKPFPPTAGEAKEAPQESLILGRQMDSVLSTDSPVTTTAPVQSPALPPADSSPMPAKDAWDFALQAELGAKGPNVAQQQQPVPPANRPPVAERKPAGESKDNLALLSLAIDLTPPEGSLLKTFRYAGADSTRSGIALQLGYVDEQSGTVLRLFLAALVGLVGWFLRRRDCLTKATAAVLGLTIPIALLPLAPQSLQVALDGLFLGVVAACGLWLIVGIMNCAQTCCVTCCSWLVTKKSGPVAGLWILTAVLLAGNTAQAQPAAPNAAPAAPAAPPIQVGTTLVVPFDAGTDPQAAEKILLPFDKFRDLYRQAYPDNPMRGTAPSAGGVVEALYSASIVANAKTPEDSTVDVQARFAIRSYVDGQFQVELPIGAIAPRDAKLDGKNAPLIVNGVCSKVAISTPGLHVVDLAFSIPARLSGSTGTFTLPLTPVPSGKLSLALPAKDLSVRINGSSTIFRRITKGDAQSVEIPVDKGGDLVVAWQPEQARGAAAAVVHVDSVQAVTLTDAGTRVSTGFLYRIRQGSVADVSFSLPEAFRLQAVKGPDVGGWELQGEADARKLRVLFRRNITDTTQLTVETFLDAKVGTESTVIDIPQLAPLEVTNEIGQVAVFAGDQFSLRAEKVESLTQIDAAKFTTTLPVSKPNVPPQLAYRFSRRPFTLALRVSRQESQANVTAQQAAFVTRRKQQLTTRLTYNLTGSPRSMFNVALPAGFVVLDVKATGLTDWSVGTLNDQSALTIDLDAPRLGLAEVVLSGTVPREDDLAATLEFPRPLDATKLNSAAAVWLDEGFTATLETFEGWRSVDASLVNGDLKAVRPNQPVQFAFQTQAASPEGISLKLKQAQPKLSANGLAMVTVTDVAVIHTLALQWQIDAATTDSLVFTTPNFLAGKLEFTGNGIRETTHVDAGNGRTRWTIWFRTPISGKFFAAAIATLPPVTTEVTAPSVVFERGMVGNGANGANGQPAPVDGQRQYVLLINSSQSQLTSATPELTEAVQREDVPLVVDQSLVDQATELVRVKQLLSAPRWTLQKYAQTAGAPASVNVADLATIVSRDGTYRGLANYIIKNRSRQFLALKLPPNSELLSVFVGNLPSRAVTTKRNNQTVQLIALPKTSAASLSFPVRIIWRGSLGKTLPKAVRVREQLLDFPAPVVVGQQDADFGADFGIPVARTRWSVWLPEDLDVRPLKDANRHNLTLQQSDQADLLYEKAAVQELSELLGFVEQNYSGANNRAQARNNMKQIGMALENAKVLERAVQQKSGGEDVEFSQQRGQALKRLSELQKSIQDEQSKMNPAAGIPVGNANGGIIVQGNGGDGIQLDQQAIVSNTIDNNNTLFFSNNSFSGIAANPNDAGQTFNFDLKNKDVDEKKNAESDKAAKANPKAANLETRQQLQSANEAQISRLNRSISQGKASGQGGQQGQFGGGGFGSGLYGGGQAGQFGRLPTQGQPGGGQFGQFGDFNNQAGYGLGMNVNGQQPTLRSGAAAQPGNPQTGVPNFGWMDGTTITGNSGNGIDISNVDARGIRDINAVGQPQNWQVGGNLGGVARNYNRYNEAAPSDPAGATRRDVGPIDLDIDGKSDRAEFERMLAIAQRGEGLVQGGEGRGAMAGAPGGSAPAWTQSGGLSLPFNLPATGKKLVFSKTGGDPMLALAVRPRESIRWGLNVVWCIVWLAIGVAIVVALRSASVMSQLSRQLPVAIAALSVLCFVVLPNPLSGCCFVTFVVMALIVAWIHRDEAKTATRPQ